jgi:Surface-adhesin protein E
MKRFLQLAIVFLVCLLSFATVWGEEWIYYGRYTDSYYFDREDINNPDENSHNIVGVWQKIVYTEKSVSRIADLLGEQYADLAESVSLVELNCASAEAQIKAITYYDSKGRIIHTSHKTKDDWKEVIPSFPLHKLYKAVCSSKRDNK